jgi:hypothetical protein
VIFRAKSSSFKRLCHPACPGAPWDRSVPGFPTSQNSPTTTCAAFRRESRTVFATPPSFTGNSGERSGEPALSGVEGDLLFLLCPSNLTAPNKVTALPLVIPTGAKRSGGTCGFTFGRSESAVSELPPGSGLAVRSVFALALEMIAFPPENLRNYLGFETFCRGIRRFLGKFRLFWSQKS